MQNKIKIFLVEDDTNLGFVMKDNLEINQYEVNWQTDGQTAWQVFQQTQFDICILDIMLPNKDGFSLATDIRKLNADIPIIFVSAKSMKDDKLKGFKIGADDYLTKPFSIEELLARIEVILKRSQKTTKNTPITPHQIGNYHFDFKNLQLTLGQTTKNLTLKEAELLKLFAENLNQVLERDRILNQLWGDDDYFTGRSLDVFISRLRKYLKDDPKIEIQNIHRVGFKLIIKE
ncbi:MAG: DNA-binding response regulator [Cytophagales bacterium]|nr:MAG: DNA-binding response regulator [Cytophagales bacterium]